MTLADPELTGRRVPNIGRYRGACGLYARGQPDPRSRLSGKSPQHIQAVSTPAQRAIGRFRRIRCPHGASGGRRRGERRISGPDAYPESGLGQRQRCRQAGNARADDQRVGTRWRHRPTVAVRRFAVALLPGLAACASMPSMQKSWSAEGEVHAAAVTRYRRIDFDLRPVAGPGLGIPGRGEGQFRCLGIQPPGLVAEVRDGLGSWVQTCTASKLIACRLTWAHTTSYAAQQYSLITPPSTFWNGMLAREAMSVLFSLTPKALPRSTSIWSLSLHLDSK